MLILFKDMKSEPDNIYRKHESGNDIKDLKNNQRASRGIIFKRTKDQWLGLTTD